MKMSDYLNKISHYFKLVVVFMEPCPEGEQGNIAYSASCKYKQYNSTWLDINTILKYLFCRIAAKTNDLKEYL